MKNTMKRIISLVLVCLTLVSTFAFAGCGDPEMTCEICGQTKNSKTYTVTDNGVEKKVCSDCNKLFDIITPDAE